MLIQIMQPSNFQYQPSWVMVVIVLSFMLLGYLYSAYNSRVQLFVKAVFFSRYSQQSSREERSLSHPVTLILTLNFLLTAPLFILQLLSSGTLDHLHLEFSLVSYLLIALSILAIYAVKTIFLKVFAFILDQPEAMSEYIFTVFLVHQFLGVCLLPVTIFIAYAPGRFPDAFLFSGILLFSLAFLVRVGKGFAGAVEHPGTTLFYLILYLCTLEILPLLIGFKLFERLT